MSAGPGLRVALLGGLLLGFATPPALVPFGEWLVLPALACWFAIAIGSKRPALHSYLFGCAHMAWFSWSIRHVMVGAYLAIVFVGGLYYLAASACVRGAPRRLREVAFALAVAGSFWLRAVMPEICYPHGQPCHSLYEWPTLMRCVTVGGEPLMNGLLALVSACAVGVWSSWRAANPAWGAAWRRLLLAVGALCGCAFAGNLLLAAASGEGVPRAVDVVAIEPGFRPEPLAELPLAELRDYLARFEEERLRDPTRAALAGGPALVLWPESSVGAVIDAARIGRGGARLRPGIAPVAEGQLLLGAAVREASAAGSTPAAILVDLSDGRVQGYQAKQRLVPGGEFVPFLSLLPESWASWVREQFRASLGSLPQSAAGGVRPPLETTAGVPFGALLCYDNAFYGPAAAQVEQGAEFLVVLSNEGWYRGGAELQQLVAMTVVRACENAVPIVRCTMDGWTVAVDAAGELQQGLPLDHEIAEGRPRALSVPVQRGLGKPPAMRWLRRSTGWISGIALAIGLLGALLARRRRAGGRSGPEQAGGSAAPTGR